MCITELDVGGAEKAFVRIATGLQKRHWQVSVISLRDCGPLAGELQEAGIPVTALHCSGITDIRVLRRLTREITNRETPADVLLTFLHQANSWGRLAAARAARTGMRPRRVVSGIRVADRRRIVTFPERLTHHLVDHYIACAEAVGREHVRLCGIPEAKMTAILNGVDLPPERSPRSHQSSETPVHRLLFVGRLTPQKAPLDLLTAFQLMPKELQKQATLTYVGDGRLRSALESAIAHTGLGDRVTCVGQVENVTDYMADSTMLVLPSKWEGVPNVVLEAMANALPVVATDVDGTSEVITNDQTGWLVPQESPQALAARIAVVLADSKARARVSVAAQEHVRKHFTWDAAVDRYDRLLRRLLSEGVSSEPCQERF